MTASARISGKRLRAAADLLAAGLLAWLATAALAQTLKIPDFRDPSTRATTALKPGEACDRCGVIRAIREKQVPRPVCNCSTSARWTDSPPTASC